MLEMPALGIGHRPDPIRPFSDPARVNASGWPTRPADFVDEGWRPGGRGAERRRVA